MVTSWYHWSGFSILDYCRQPSNLLSGSLDHSVRFSQLAFRPCLFNSFTTSFLWWWICLTAQFILPCIPPLTSLYNMKVNLSHKSAKTMTITLARFISKSVVSLSCILSEHHTNAMSLYFVVVLNICTFMMKYNCLSHDVKSLRIFGIEMK